MPHVRSTNLRIPAPDWMRDYQSGWLKSDVAAGLTAAMVVIPMALAHAAIAGLPLQVGLYTALVPMLIYAVLGTSRPLNVSTTTTMAILTGAELGRFAAGADPAQLASALCTLSLMVGAILVLASLLRLGAVASLISQPVLVGFKAGIGLIILVDQAPKLLGIAFQKGSFLHNVLAIAQGIPHTSLITLGIGVLTIALMIVIERFLPRGPAPIIAVAVGIACVGVLGLDAQGVKTVGHIPSGLPSFILPDVSLLEQFWAGALGIALMSFTETVAVGRAFVTSDEPSPAANRELLAIGIANAGGALLGAMPTSGGTTQTAVKRLSGARTQLASLATASATLLTMFFLAPLIALMPQATLAGVVVVYAAGLIEPAEFRTILKVRRTEFVWALAASAGVVLLGTLKGILVAIVVSVVALAMQVANPPVHMLGRKAGTNVFRPRSPEHPDDETFPGLLMVRLEGRIFFANAENIAQKMRALILENKPKVVALDLSAVFDIEYTALKMLTEAEKKQREAGLTLWLVGLEPNVLAMVQHSPLGETLGRERMFFNLEMAVAKYLGASEKGQAA